MHEQLPVAVIGAGPVGLAAAAHLLSRGLEPVVFEAGDGVGASVREWAHVRVFSPWEYDIDPTAAELLDRSRLGRARGRRVSDRWRRSSSATSSRWPRCRRIAERLHLNARVLAVTRRGVDKLKDAGRDEAAFELRVERDGVEERHFARAVIDASGTWTRPNPLGAGGLPAVGERAARRPHRLRHPGRPRRRPRPLRRPSRAGGRQRPLGPQRHPRPRRAARATSRDTEIVWAIRGAELGTSLGGGAADQLPARGALGRAVRRLLDDGAIELVTGFQTEGVGRDGDRAGGGRRSSGAGRRRGHRGDRLPARSGAAGRAAPGARRSRRGAARAGAADRPQRALVRVGAAARRRRALAPRRRRLRCRDEELRARADLPAAHRLRAGPLGRGGAGRRLGVGAPGRARASRDRRLQRARAVEPRASRRPMPAPRRAAARRSERELVSDAA